MSFARQTVKEYTALLARAFNGGIEVNGERIVAHPSGTLLARTPRREPRVVWQAPALGDRDNDWSEV